MYFIFIEGYPRENGLSKFNSGLCTVPMKIEDDFGNTDMSTLVAGKLKYMFVHYFSEKKTYRHIVVIS